MTNDDMLQKIKYYMVLSPLFLFIRSHCLLCLVVKHLIETILPFVLFFLTFAVPTGAFECETAARCHLLYLKPYLE